MLGAAGEDVRERWMAELLGVRVDDTPDPLGLALPSFATSTGHARQSR